MPEKINQMWPASPSVRNDPKMIALVAVEQALRDLYGPEKIAGVVIILAYADGAVSCNTNMHSKAEAERAIVMAAKLAGIPLINRFRELGEGAGIL
jgi:hypothetical protein